MLDVDISSISALSRRNSVEVVSQLMYAHRLHPRRHSVEVVNQVMYAHRPARPWDGLTRRHSV